MMLAQNENQSILIHDIKKHLQSIRLLNEKNDSDKINDYIQQLMESSDLKETTKLCDHEMLTPFCAAISATAMISTLFFTLTSEAARYNIYIRAI